MHVAVLIVAFQNAADVERCLRALACSTYTDFEVVVCENGDNDAYRSLTSLIADRAPRQVRTKLIHAPANGGFASGVNICSRAVPDADCYWILNPDTEPDAGAMEALVNKLSTGKCDAAGGILFLPDGRTQSYGGVWIPWRGRFVSIGFGSFPGKAIGEAQIERRQNYLSGASMMVGRNFLRRAGEMREDYFLYGEEVAWCIEAARRGLRLGFCPTAKVIHYQGTSTGCTERISDRSRISVYLGERNRILLTRLLSTLTLARHYHQLSGPHAPLWAPPGMAATGLCYFRMVGRDPRRAWAGGSIVLACPYPQSARSPRNWPARHELGLDPGR